MARFTLVVLSIIFCTLSTTAVEKKSPVLKIVGGQDASITKLPYQVSITTYGFHYCGGSIINKWSILTAAHCVRKRNAADIAVRVGSSHRWKGGVTYNSSQLIPNADFKLRNLDFDVGLIITKEPIQFGPDVQPIGLPEPMEALPVGEIATVSGWGLKESGGDITENLQEVKIPILDHDTCQATHKKKIYPRMFCAGDLKGGRDACQQDSGGPCVVGNKLVGIVSWGENCGKPNSPGVYTYVASVVDWIKANWRQ